MFQCGEGDGLYRATSPNNSHPLLGRFFHRQVGRIVLPPWIRVIYVMTGVTALIAISQVCSRPYTVPQLRVAFIGNSMQYYNDFPRFMQALSDGHLIQQNSCLHGNADLRSIWQTGNGMYKIWSTGNARIFDDNSHPGDDDDYELLYDFGACTVEQMLFGTDNTLDKRIQSQENGGDDDFFAKYDGTNPCFESNYYYHYLQNIYSQKGTPKFDMIVINDNTRSPARYVTRLDSLEVLEQVYLPWFLQTGATPVFICTYAYWTPYRDMGGLGNVSEFTSLTYHGYQQYAALLEKSLPAAQKPRISPVALAFLIVYEENYSLWQRLFHIDRIHTSPLGTFLQGCVVHHTLFGVMPKTQVALKYDLSSLWLYARRFQPGNHRRSPFPTREEAAYLYHVATRVTVHHERPRTFRKYHQGEAAMYSPQDDLYRIDDIF